MTQTREAEPPVHGPFFKITRLPPSLVRREHGVVKDHVVYFHAGDETMQFAWRIPDTFAGYLAGKMAGLVSNPQLIDGLEQRLNDPDLTPEAQVLFTAMVKTARRIRTNSNPPSR